MTAKDIYVLAEVHQGQLAGITFELLGCARELAASTGGGVTALLIGQDVSSFAPSLEAADQIVAVEDPLLATFTQGPYLAVLEEIVRTRQPRALLIGSTTMGLDLASALAARIGAPCANACQKVQADGDSLKITSLVYSGKMIADVEISSAPAVLTVLPGSYREAREGGRAEVEKLVCPVVLEPYAVSFEEMILPEAGDIDITQEEILIAVGRGIESADNLEVAEELAKAIGGAICASRPVVDQEWLKTTRQVGKSGMTVKPKCYLALGISGAPEHIEGMKDSDLIIAVDSDPNAPIFDIANYGVVTDLLDFTPALTEKLNGR